MIATKIVSHCRRSLRNEVHSAIGWVIGGSVKLQTVKREKTAVL